MDKETQGWLVGVPFETQGNRPHEKLRLSSQHKRELANVTGLLMASTVFFLTPLIVSAPDPSASESQLAQESSAVPRQPVIDVATTIAMPTGSMPLPVVVRYPSAACPEPCRRDAPPSARALVQRRSAPSDLGGVMTVALNTTRAPSTVKVSGRKERKASGLMMRVLVGSGRYRVQPFPTPDAND